MSINRRKFLRAGTLVALSAAIPLKSVWGQGNRKGSNGNPTGRAQEAAKDNLANYNKATFESYLNSIFRLYSGSAVVEIALVEVKDIGSTTAKPQPGAESFSLLFRGGTRTIDQGTYTVDHPALGRFQLFLTPGKTDDNGAASYVAVINRIPYSPTTPPGGTSKPGHTLKPDTNPPAKPVEPVQTKPTKTATPAPARPERNTPRRSKPQSPWEIE